MTHQDYYLFGVMTGALVAALVVVFANLVKD